MPKPVLIFGATPRGKNAANILQQNNVMVYGFLDDNPTLQGKAFGEATVLGKVNDERLLALLHDECTAFIALGEPNAYYKLWQQIVRSLGGRSLVNVIHSDVRLNNAKLGEGNCLQAGVQLHSDVLLSSHCTLGSYATVQCDTILHDFVYLGVGAILGSNVLVEKNATISDGAIIGQGVTIGEGTYVPAGAVIHHDIPAFTRIPNVVNSYVS